MSEGEIFQKQYKPYFGLEGSGGVGNIGDGVLSSRFAIKENND